jgi:hypothetical protein
LLLSARDNTATCLDRKRTENERLGSMRSKQYPY